jgi:hypothetical protein
MKRILTILVVLLCIATPPDSKGYSVKCIRMPATTVSLVNMLKPRLDPEIAQIHAKYLDKQTQLWGVDRDTFVSVVNEESGFNSMAVNRKSGAKGASQIYKHPELIRKRRLMPHEVFYLDNNYSMGCELIHEAEKDIKAKKKSCTLDRVLTAYVGGYAEGYIPSIKKNIAKCKAMTTTKLIIGSEG